MKRIFTICIVAVACLVATLCNSCSVEEPISTDGYTYTMRVDAVLNGFDGSATRSAYDWPDGAKLYVQFHEGGNRVQGFAEYSESNDWWTVTTRTGLSNVGSGTCEAYYFEHSAEFVDVVELSANVPVYQDVAGSYICDGNGLAVSLVLTPRTGRIRFCGEGGRVFTVSGLTHLSAYEVSSNNFSSTSKSLSLTVSEDGYTPYLYASFPEASRTLTIIDGDMKYTRECTEAVLLSGRSGSMTLPSASSHDGWVMEEINQIDESAVAEAIDLGLSVEWASWNVGATAPEEYGGYYAWGETEMKSGDDYENLDIGSDISGTEYDVAHVKWGDGWRMPTLEEFRELATGCSWEWTSVNNVYGLKGTGPNGNFIFLPGFRESGGCYWSSTLFESFSSYAHHFCFNSGVDGGYFDVFSRASGYAIRPVRNKEPKPEPVVAEAIDLGLSVKWASWNVGATAPEEYGDYFAWGETEVKDDYSEDTYLYYQNGVYVDLGADISGTEYDVAHVKWGDKWRMPTLDEILELCYNCSWNWTTQNGVNGYKVTGPNGNSIFLPAAGYRIGTEVYYRGSDGSYWSGALVENDSGDAYSLYFDSGHWGWLNYGYRNLGFTVRPVTN
ncbi:MAG: DUF1566 domain-containing protein [Bacteroidales bacterium]|nr:DUF1566 domain-containing protein [Bacteroidales bacterium]